MHQNAALHGDGLKHLHNLVDLVACSDQHQTAQNVIFYTAPSAFWASAIIKATSIGAFYFYTVNDFRFIWHCIG